MKRTRKYSVGNNYATKGKVFLIITNDEYELFNIGPRIEHVLNCNFVIRGRRKKKRKE